jgi:hypothetical protein
LLVKTLNFISWRKSSRKISKKWRSFDWKWTKTASRRFKAVCKSFFKKMNYNLFLAAKDGMAKLTTGPAAIRQKQQKAIGSNLNTVSYSF